ncbi:hypothetical protein SAMN04489844_4019 [Nocardioides exalbidus]|uniref:Mce-associated membrane protein n=1 Tax=Nocardioides exalbidus TaxID=402596 RepID=A0A1H4Z7A2_9ACTN|nr:hypothetical protein [Nocardioides exalbidus]SED25220.1 hypothetical protein SAMN04489844_4019 [Nocardioides exalbidus]
MSGTLQKRVAWALALLVVVCAGTLAWLVRSDAEEAPTTTSAASADAEVASTAVKEAARTVAADAASAAYGYSWKTVAEDKAAARAMMTPAMQRQYDRTTAGVVTESQQVHTVVTAQVAGTALVTATTSYARVLVFVNQETTDDTLEKPLLDLDRVLVTLQHDGEEWKVSELDAL